MVNINNGLREGPQLSWGEEEEEENRGKECQPRGLTALYQGLMHSSAHSCYI